ncbi:hypothetical protein JHD50_06555 [Sulfurimonas sp. MAG313]|nr:hypothetical protein [Sulfurimonas sp. MAG313]MDF1880966.1 hypothetical protein [Sulfurimonas sp. MAG313]
MTKREEVNESCIKDALAQGYITKLEAQDMLNVYLYKTSFSKTKSHVHKTLIMRPLHNGAVGL